VVRALSGRGQHLEAFYACLYYAALRPSEAVMLREGDLYLPPKGWGRIVLAASASRAGTAWTDHGTARQERGLKHRAAHETRTIPIPPELVKLLRAHIKRYGTTPDGRIFQTARGGILQDSAYNEVWAEARTKALTEAQCRSPLGRRPYDLRHAAVSLWLNSGVPATEVARRAGHGVAVLLKIYAHCIDGQADAANLRITDALSTPEPDQDPGGEGDADSRSEAEMAGQRQEAGRDGRRNRSCPRRPCPSVVSAPPDPGADGRIADGDSPQLSLEPRTRRSAGGDSGGASGL
jgi:Phage integrase family